MYSLLLLCLGTTDFLFFLPIFFSGFKSVSSHSEAGTVLVHTEVPQNNNLLVSDAKIQQWQERGQQGLGFKNRPNCSTQGRKIKICWK